MKSALARHDAAAIQLIPINWRFITEQAAAVLRFRDRYRSGLGYGCAFFGG
jgi:hypothetical protein